MPKLHLHVRGNDFLAEDWEGAEYDSLDEARAEAIRGARQIMAERLMRGEVLDGSMIEIVDAAGKVVIQVPFKDALA
jgi:hypothetical protein